jgi:hypothetical protein
LYPALLTRNWLPSEYTEDIVTTGIYVDNFAQTDIQQAIVAITITAGAEKLSGGATAVTQTVSPNGETSSSAASSGSSGATITSTAVKKQTL